MLTLKWFIHQEIGYLYPGNWVLFFLMAIDAAFISIIVQSF